jgi:hypothetical protein
MKKNLFYLCVLLCSVGLTTGCIEKDSKSESESGSDVTGSWLYEGYYVQEVKCKDSSVAKELKTALNKSGDFADTMDEIFGGGVKFTKDGTVILDGDEFDYSLKNGKFTIYDEDDDPWSLGTIEVSDDELIWEVDILNFVTFTNADEYGLTAVITEITFSRK